MSVPWQDRAIFQEAVGFLSRMDRIGGQELDPVRGLAGEIQCCFDQISDKLDEICSLTCPECSDNCCERATIWYDFRDLVYLYFSPGRMPECQIVKVKGMSRCPHLEPSGCTLARSRRPFVCTWYFCPEQKAMPSCGIPNETTLKIKKLRSRMEDVFCRITAGEKEFSGRL